MFATRLMLLCLGVVCSLCLAQSTEPARRRGPPAEAITACAGLSEGTSCGFTVNGNNLTGTCRVGPNNEAAACRPAGGRHGPPPEALEVCKGQNGGAACTFTLGDKTVTGTCAAGHSDELACRPADEGPGGHHRGPPPEAREACKSVALGAACAFTGRGRAVSGTCEQGPEGEGLACRPSGRPVQE